MKRYAGSVRLNRRIEMNGISRDVWGEGRYRAAAAVLLMACVGPAPALADTIEAALVRAYQGNPQLNAQRALVRSTDENVPQALSGYRPKVNLYRDGRHQYTDALVHRGRHSTARAEPNSRRQAPRSVGITAHPDAVQRPADGQRDPCRGESGLGRARGLRVLEQTVLLTAATIYMDYLLDSAILRFSAAMSACSNRH